MLPKTYDTQDCSIARALEIVGERWTLLIIREALFGRSRFDEFTAALGIASNTLTQRLQSLVDADIMVRAADPDDLRRRTYRLTGRGQELAIVIGALREWGDRNASGRRSPPVSMRHPGCGGQAETVARCAKCGDDLTMADVERQEHRPVRRG